MSTVEHARAELQRVGALDQTPEWAESLVAAVEAFASYGHSGGSAMVGIDTLFRLLRQEALSPLSSDPDEWADRSAESGMPWWQNVRDSRAMSHDGGKTWWYVEGRYPGERTKDGGEWGVLVRCPQCSGDGLLHKPDVVEPGPAPKDA